MPENLLQELDCKLPADGDHDTVDALDAWKQSLDSAARAYAKEVRARVRGILGTREQLMGAWVICRQHVIAGHTEVIHAIRGRFLGALEKRLALLRKAYDLVCYASRIMCSELPEAGELQAEIKVLGPALERLESRWQTPEDLEDLVAESLAPSPEKLEAVARKYGGPSEWYRQDAERS